MSKTTKTVKSLANGYRTGGNYHAIIATLETMGTNKWHAYDAFAAKLEKTWEGWKAFAKKEARNEATAKDTQGRLLQNVRVLQRTNDYAKPLLEAGAVIDLKWEGQTLQIQLNTKSKKPQTPGRAAKVEAVKAAPKAAKKAAKPSKSKAPILSGREAIEALKGKRKAA